MRENLDPLRGRGLTKACTIGLFQKINAPRHEIRNQRVGGSTPLAGSVISMGYGRFSVAFFALWDSSALLGVAVYATWTARGHHNDLGSPRDAWPL
jgi:hypothetical protein